MASRTFFADIDLDQNEIKFAVLHSTATAPSSGTEAAGQVYYDTVSNQPFYYNGSSWISMSSSSASSVPFSGVEAGTNTGQTLILGTGSIFRIGAGSFQFLGSSTGIMTLGTNLTGSTDRTINLPNITGTSTILATSDTPTTGHFAKQSSGAAGTIEFSTIAHSDLTGLTTGDPHTQYITLTPTTSARNVIDPTTNDVTSLIVEGAPNSGIASFNYFVIRNSSAASLFTVEDDAGSRSATFHSGLASVISSSPVTLNAVNLLFTRTSQTITLAIPASGVTGYTFTLPPVAGTNGYLLSTNGSGVTSWIDPATVGVTDHGALTGLTDDDHTQYIHLVPGTSARNVINPTANDITSLIVEGAPNAGPSTFNYFVVRNSSAANLFTIGDDTGTFVSEFTSNLYRVTVSTPLRMNAANIEFFRSSQTITLAIPSSGVTGYTFTLPPVAGTNGHVLKTNGSGTTSWGTLAHSELTDLTSGDPHTQYVTLTPTTSARNVIDPTTNDITSLIVEGAPNSGIASFNYFVIRNSSAASLFTVEDDAGSRSATFHSGLASVISSSPVTLNAVNLLFTRTSQTITLAIPASGVTGYTFTLPPVAGTNGHVLKTNGSGVTSWGTLAHSDITGLTAGDPHTQYVAISPVTTARNIIQPTSSTAITMSIRGHISQSVDIFVVESVMGTDYFSISSSGDATFSQDVIVNGDLTINGTTTTLNTTELIVEDNIIVVNSGGIVQDAGLEVDRGSNGNASIFYKESEDEWYIDNASVSLQIARKFVDSSTITGDGVETSFDIVHNMATFDLIVAVYDSDDYQVEVEILLTDSNTVTANFSQPVPMSTTYKVVIVG